MERTCTKCNKTYPMTLEYFPPSKQNKSGFTSWCRECKRASNRIATKAYYSREENKIKKKEWDKENREYLNEYHRNRDRDKVNAYYRELYTKNKSRKLYYKSYKGVRSIRVLNATLQDTALKKQMEQIYANCPEGCHVDHIIPITNKLVCGLHTPSNLQYLPAKENMQKSNKFTPYVESTNVKE